MSLPPKYQPSFDFPLGTHLGSPTSLATTRKCELEDELSHAFQLMGLDAPGFIETLRHKPADFLADERPCVQRLAEMYQSMVPPPTTEDRIARLEITGEQVMSRLEILGEQMSRPRFATRILTNECDDLEIVEGSPFVSHSLRCGNHYIAVNRTPRTVVALLLPPLSKCIPGNEIRISSGSLDTWVIIMAAGDGLYPQMPEKNTPSRASITCLRMDPKVGFLTFAAVPHLSSWMVEGSSGVVTFDATWTPLTEAWLKLDSLTGAPGPTDVVARGFLREIHRNLPICRFVLSKKQSENWPVTWDAESSELEL